MSASERRVKAQDEQDGRENVQVTQHRVRLENLALRQPDECGNEDYAHDGYQCRHDPAGRFLFLLFLASVGICEAQHFESNNNNNNNNNNNSDSCSRNMSNNK